jgi:hypothetical protein
MSVWLRRHALRLAIVVYLVLLLPPARHLLEGRMVLQMLVQIPLLAAVGYRLRDALPRAWQARLDPWNHRGISGLVLATLAGAYWMLPRVLDAAVSDPRFALTKFLSVPLLIGLPLGLSWPRAGFVARGVVLLELIATCFRLGWLYMVSPIRLCNAFLLDDQQHTGQVMLAIGGVLLVGIIGQLMWGRFDPEPGPLESEDR